MGSEDEKEGDLWREGYIEREREQLWDLFFSIIINNNTIKKQSSISSSISFLSIFPI